MRRSGSDRTGRATDEAAHDADAPENSSRNDWLANELAPIEDDVNADSDGAIDSHDQLAIWPRIALALLALAAVTWIAFYVLAVVGLPAPMQTAQQISAHIVTVSAPLALILLAALFVQRGARAELRRHANAARRMQASGTELARQIDAIRTQIDEVREKIDGDIARLSEIGRESAGKLADHAASIGTALETGRAQASELDVISGRAHHNLATLQKDLPTMIGYSRDLTNGIGEAGTTAIERLRELESGWRRMDEQRRASESGLSVLKESAATHIDELLERLSAYDERFSEMLDSRRTDSDRLADHMQSSLEEAGERLVGHFAEADVRLAALIEEAQSGSRRFAESLDRELASAQQRTAALLGEVDEAGTRFDAEDAARTERLRDQFAELTNSVERVTELREREGAELRALLESVDAQFEEAAAQIAQLNERGSAQAAQLAFALEASSGNIRKLSETLGQNEAATEAIIRQNRQLADLLDGHVETLGSTLPSNLGRFAERLSEIRESIAEQGSMTRDMENQGERLIVRFGKLDECISAQKSVIEELSAVSESLFDEEKLAGDARAKAEAVRQAYLEILTRGVDTANDGAAKLERKLTRLTDMTRSLEARIEAAERDFPGADDEGFARRMALLAEALNSAAIDVAKILSTEVTDTAWQDYLKGDRGVFTRRAVRLLDAQEMKIVADQYEWDKEFRAQVNRYIHDFEDMMRQLLSTRDGHRISVTLLSSDVGKLYVALAQAIERLRT